MRCEVATIRVIVTSVAIFETMFLQDLEAIGLRFRWRSVSSNGRLYCDFELAEI